MVAPEFTMEVRAGDIIPIIGYVGIAFVTFFNLKSEVKTQLSVYKLRLDWIDAAIEDAKRDLKASAITNWRLAALEEQVKDMKERYDSHPSRVTHTTPTRKQD